MKRMCKCGKLIEYHMKFCSSCEIKYEEDKKEQQRFYDSNYRDRVSAAFYKSREWEKIRAAVLSMYSNIDIYLLYTENRIITANTVHHIIEVRDDYSKRLSLGNLFPTSNEGHGKIHKLYNQSPEKKADTIAVLRDMLNRYKSEYNL